MKIKRLKNQLLDIIFPPLCVSCRKHLKASEKNISLCSTCKEEIRINPRTFNIVVNNEKTLLGAATSYKNKTARNIIQTFKYNQIKEAVKSIDYLIDSYLKKSNFKQKIEKRDWVLVPIPLHESKIKRRGFNQALFVAESLKRNLKNINTEIERNNLVKTKETKSQAKLNYKNRLTNLREAFEIGSPEKIYRRNIILIDDVVTTGSTLSEAMRAIKKASPNKVACFTVSKT